MQRIVNVTTPTLTAYLPDQAKATGTAVIIAPGGGFIFLGTDTHEIAEWLAARDIAAFVLKYRTVPLEGQNEAQLDQCGGGRFGAQLNNHALIAEDGKYALDDGVQAIKVVRAHATEWGVYPDRVVFMEFSAGGMITGYTAIQPDVSARPNYAAPIYGAYFPSVPQIPKDVPPFFMEMAEDDNLAGPQIVLFYDALKAAGTSQNFTSMNMVAMAGVCANKAQLAITGLKSSIGGWSCDSVQNNDGICAKGVGVDDSAVRLERFGT